ncbi:6231_t:CDS:2 [Diversispora eburnea]|uniref:6231_t:CDS:1 n=1 Tax=Diversispora eburnea TaxID=1213867 RepID=A0A9N9A180_9GLOM|nr:6231_t:CDS:2 [Diversispora eburnea]
MKTLEDKEPSDNESLHRVEIVGGRLSSSSKIDSCIVVVVGIFVSSIEGNLWSEEIFGKGEDVPRRVKEKKKE